MIKLLCHSLVGLLWLVFLTCWILMARTAKRTVQRCGRVRWVMIRLLTVIAILSVVTQVPREYRRGLLALFDSPLLAITGLVLCASGIGLALWARVHLGRNWGMPMSIKEKPELVTTGPYRFLRHPIYTGVFFALLGTALDVHWIWFLVCLLNALYFISCAREEDKLLEAQFPEVYPDYKRRTWRLIPFVY